MWYFRDLSFGYQAIFSTEEKAVIFVKEYGLKMYDLNNQFPVVGEDYTLDFYELNPKFSDYLEKEF